MNKENLRKKLDTGTAYFLYCVILMAIAVVIVLAAHIFTNHGIITEIIAAFLAAIITAMITRVLLRQQTQSNLEMVEKQGEKNLEEEYKKVIVKDRMRYAHQYLDLVYEILEDGKVTQSEVLKLNIALQHLLYNPVTDITEKGIEEVRTLPFEGITTAISEILSAINDGEQNSSRINLNLVNLTYYLHSLWYGATPYDNLQTIERVVDVWSKMGTKK